MSTPDPYEEVRRLRWELDELRAYIGVQNYRPPRRWVKPVVTGVAILAAFLLGHADGAATQMSDCGKVAAEIVVTGHYVAGLETRDCVGEKDDVRVQALIDMHDANQ